MTQLRLVIGNKNYSSWSLRPWLALKQFGVQFEEIRIPLYTPETASKLQEYSPSRKVPALIHNNQIIWDSLAICEYLAEEFPAMHWWPEDKINRALARSISAEMHSGFVNLRQNMPMNCRAKFPGKGLNSEVQKDIDRITSIWQEFRRKFASEGDMLFGKFTIADAMFAPVVLRFVIYDVQLDSISRKYAEAILELPALQEWLEAANQEIEVLSQYELYRDK